MRRVLPVVSTLLIMMVPQGAAATSRLDRQFDRPLYPVEAKGCYFRRGREYCGRYCYIEVNGKRYCQERLRDAVPQAGFEYFWEPGSPRSRGMK
jgi:hypothetical protein